MPLISRIAEESWLHSLHADFALARRRLLKSKAITSAALLSIALGIVVEQARAIIPLHEQIDIAVEAGFAPRN